MDMPAGFDNEDIILALLRAAEELRLAAADGATVSASAAMALAVRLEQLAHAARAEPAGSATQADC